MAIILAIPVLMFALLAGLVVINDGSLFAFVIGLALLFLVRFIIGKNFVTVCLDENDFFIQRAFYAKEFHKFSDISEIVLVSLFKKNEKRLGAGSDYRIGQMLGRMLLNVVEDANVNSHYRKQLAIKFKDNTITTFNSNYIIDGNELVKKLSKKSNVIVKDIPIEEFTVWKKG